MDKTEEYKEFEKKFCQAVKKYANLAGDDFYNMKFHGIPELKKKLPASRFVWSYELKNIRFNKNLKFYDKTKVYAHVKKKSAQTFAHIRKAENDNIIEIYKSYGFALKLYSIAHVLIPLSKFFEIRLIFISWMTIDFRFQQEQSNVLAFLLKHFARRKPVINLKKEQLTFPKKYNFKRKLNVNNTGVNPEQEFKQFCYSMEIVVRMLQYLINKTKKVQLEFVPSWRTNCIFDKSTDKTFLDILIEKYNLEIPKDVLLYIKNKLKEVDLKTLEVWATVAHEALTLEINRYFRLVAMLHVIFESIILSKTPEGVPIIPKGKITEVFYDWIKEERRANRSKEKVFIQLKQFILETEKEFFDKSGIWTIIQSYSDKNMLHP